MAFFCLRSGCLFILFQQFFACLIFVCSTKKIHTTTLSSRTGKDDICNDLFSSKIKGKKEQPRKKDKVQSNLFFFLILQCNEFAVHICIGSKIVWHNLTLQFCRLSSQFIALLVNIFECIFSYILPQAIKLKGKKSCTYTRLQYFTTMQSTEVVFFWFFLPFSFSVTAHPKTDILLHN